MISARETQEILERFFDDCLRFWMHQGSDHGHKQKAFKLALEDVKSIHRNPFVPCGDELDAETKANFIMYREMDLGEVM